MYQTTMQGDLRIKDTILYIVNVHNIVSNTNAGHSLSWKQHNRHTVNLTN